MRTLGASVLAFEAVVIALAIPVAVTTQDVSGTAAGVAGGGLALACLIVAALLRYRWAYAVGWVVQVLAVVSGFVVPAMFFLGAVFAVLWAVALRLGSRFDHPPPAPPGGADQAAG